MPGILIPKVSGHLEVTKVAGHLEVTKVAGQSYSTEKYFWKFGKIKDNICDRAGFWNKTLSLFFLVGVL